MMEEKKLTTECLYDAAQSVSELRDYSPWYAIKLYTTRQKEAADYFQNKGLETLYAISFSLKRKELRQRCVTL